LKKFTDFIVNKRHIILILFIILSIISVILSKKVNINYDIAEYLPSTSETRIGMDIMDQNFKEIKSSSLDVMFEDLQEDRKTQIYQELTQINGVSSVDYDHTENCNKDKYTLYVINVDDTEDSELASNVYKEITKNYKNDTIYTGGEIAERNNPVLPTWIVVLAVGCALIILIIMCESYVEPFLFLASILIGVLLNNGTNIIFGTVSNITSSISAILQMALSMDYSIMLMNRYAQEKQKETDKVKAMKNALYNAFKAISSSSVTTIVGLLALVFMSFTIGRDLGFVLAKGVLFSLISIFFVLPSLILMFDKWIAKTKKRSPNLKMDGLGKISYKLRHIALVLFLIAFLGSYLLKGNLGISYTDTTLNEINKVFTENNQIALIYNSKDEEIVAEYLKELENQDKVEEVLGYGNTINEKLTYDKLNQKLSDLGTETSVDDYLLKIIYYNYYNQDENNTISFDEFVKFIQEDVYKNSNVASKINEETKANVNRLSNFTNSTQMNKNRTLSEIANILEMNEQDAKDILIYYNSKNNNIKISLNEFIKFMNQDVLTNEKYASKVNNNAKNSLNTLSKFTNVNTIQKKMNSKEMAQLFEMSETTMNDLYTYYISVNDIDTKMTISEFANFVLSDVLSNPNYASNFDETTKNNIKMLATFSNSNIINKSMNATELSNLFGIDENLIKQLLLMKYSTTDNATTMTIAEFINYVTNIKNNTHYLDNLDISAFTGIDQTILSNPTKYTATEMSQVLNIDINQMYQIYALIDFVQNRTTNWQMTPNELVSFVLKNSNNESIKSNLDDATMGKLNLLSNIMTSTVNKTSYSYRQLSELIGIDSNTVRSIYSLYTSKYSTTKLTPQEFVKFVLEHKNDTTLSNNLDANTINNLSLLQKAMNGVVNHQKYSSQELGDLLGIHTSDLDLLFGLYNATYINANQTISLREFVDFILNDVVTNPEYSSNFNDETKSKLNTIDGIMNASLNNVKYTRNEIFGILSKLADNLDKDQVDLLYVYYGSTQEYNNNWQLTVEQFVNYLNDDILQDSRFTDFIEEDMRKSIIDAKDDVKEAKELLIGDGYSRIVINTKLLPESEETFHFIQKIKDELGGKLDEFYIIGNSPMAYEMSQTFQEELDFITILTMIAIFVVVAFTFKSITIPLILVFMIQCAVYMTMGILSFTGEKVYFISILIVQSILMGATIDYAILYTSYYLEHRKTMNRKDSIINSYNKAIHTILTSASILIIVTLIVGYFASAIAAKICKTISQGTLCSAILILVLLPAVLASCDKIIIKKKRN
jgi:predicted RND superfamily exporter protein